ncbi:hypothetical protein SAHL_15940 [Salinisphaera orenii YIM 95161]|uniref:Uncharacterized protein n=1 Tax=Salinisphaera orenii YIM 95161 TaxID=1051139 RepID=A0A423PF34_9GAMM|nr:hypothetical protein SAHL_15940 [Salinisphaera halophila YIM 95161]
MRRPRFIGEKGLFPPVHAPSPFSMTIDSLGDE